MLFIKGAFTMLKAIYLHAITASAVALDSASILDLHDLSFYALKGQGRVMKGIVCGEEDGHGLGKWLVFNRHKNNAYFDSVAVYGAVSDSQAQSLVENHFKDGVEVVSYVSMTDQALGLYLDGVQQKYALAGISQKDADLFDAMTVQSAVAWDEESNTLTSHGGNIHALMSDLKKTDINDQLLDAVTPKDIIAMLCANESGMFDAVVIKYQQLDKYVAKLAEALKKSDHEEYFVKSVTPIEPFKRNGVVNVGAIFTMSDTQTITVLFNNPDSTPAKLTGQDIVTSWKWILNKRDVTAALQPRSVDAKKFPLIAGRIYQLLAKNHQRFRSAQLIRKREELMLERAVGELEASQLEIRMLDDQIAEIQKQIDEQATANLNKTDVGKIDAGVDEKPQDESTPSKTYPPIEDLGNGYYKAFKNDKKIDDWIAHIDLSGKWEVRANVAASRATNRGFGHPKMFNSIEEMIAKYPQFGELPKLLAAKEAAQAAGQAIDDDKTIADEMTLPEGFTLNQAAVGEKWELKHNSIQDPVIISLEGDKYRASKGTAKSTNISEMQNAVDWGVNLLNEELGVKTNQDVSNDNLSEVKIKKSAIIEELKAKHDFKDATSDEVGVTALESPNGHTVEFWIDDDELEIAGGSIALDGYNPEASAVVIAKFIAHKDFESQFEYIGGEERDDEIIDDQSFFDGKTTKFALTVTNLEKAAEALGFETVYNDFTATEAVADLFDSINAGSRFIYGMTVQIGKGSKVYARGEINEDGDIKLYKGSTGAEPLNQHSFEQISTDTLINTLSLIDTSADQVEAVEPSTAQEEQAPAIDFDKYLTPVGRSYFVTVPFAIKDGFKKEFPSAKWNNVKKQWVVGKTKYNELKQWITNNIGEIDNTINQKANFAEKLSKMAKLEGDTFDIKDQLKEKFGAIFHKETKGNIVSAAWYVEPHLQEQAQEFIREHMKAKRDALDKENLNELALKFLNKVKKSNDFKTVSIDEWKERGEKYRYIMQYAFNLLKSEIPKEDDKRKYIYKAVYMDILAILEGRGGALLTGEQKLERFENDLKRYATENNFSDERKGDYINGGLRLWHRVGYGDFHIFKRNPNGNISHMKSDLKFDEKQVLSMDYNKIKEIVDPLLEEELKIAGERRAIADTRKQNIVEDILAEIQKSPYFFKDVSLSDIEKQNTNFSVEFGNFWQAEMKKSDNDLIIQSEKSAIRQEIITKLLEIHPENQVENSNNSSVTKKQYALTEKTNIDELSNNNGYLGVDEKPKPIAEKGIAEFSRLLSDDELFKLGLNYIASHDDVERSMEIVVETLVQRSDADAYYKKAKAKDTGILERLIAKLRQDLFPSWIFSEPQKYLIDVVERFIELYESQHQQDTINDDDSASIQDEQAKRREISAFQDELDKAKNEMLSNPETKMVTLRKLTLDTAKKVGDVERVLGVLEGYIGSNSSLRKWRFKMPLSNINGKSTDDLKMRLKLLTNALKKGGLESKFTLNKIGTEIILVYRDKDGTQRISITSTGGIWGVSSKDKTQLTDNICKFINGKDYEPIVELEIDTRLVNYPNYNQLNPDFLESVKTSASLKTENAASLKTENAAPTISDKQKLKIVFKKEAEKLLGSFDYRLTDLQGHTADEFKRADVPGKLNPIIAEAKAMLQRKFRDEWQREMLEKDVVRAENELERWEKAQFKQAPLVNGEIKKFLDDVIAGNVDLSDQKIGDKLIKIGENLDPTLETLFQVAAAKYAEFAMNLQF